MSGMDALFMNTETTNNFAFNGSGLLAQISIMRLMSNFVKQFNNLNPFNEIFNNNFMHFSKKFFFHKKFFFSKKILLAEKFFS